MFMWCADQQCPWLMRQVEIDTHFLQRLNVLDYSLLLAHQPLHHDERNQGLSFATLIMRTKKSVIFIMAFLKMFPACDHVFRSQITTFLVNLKRYNLYLVFQGKHVIFP